MPEVTRRPDMASLTKGLKNKSEMMRRLHAAGYSRAEIAKFLGVRYQFVRNVIVDAERRQDAASQRANPAPPEEHSPNVSSGRLKLGPDGSVVLPAHFREALSVKEGDSLVGLVEDGELRLLTIPAAIRLAQAIVRESVPAGTKLTDELLEDRRREVAREADNG